MVLHSSTSCPYDVELTQRDLITRLNEFGRVITKFPASISEFPRNPMPSQNVRLYLHMVGLGRVLRQRTFAFNGSHVGAFSGNGAAAASADEEEDARRI